MTTAKRSQRQAARLLSYLEHASAETIIGPDADFTKQERRYLRAIARDLTQARHHLVRLASSVAQRRTREQEPS